MRLKKLIGDKAFYRHVILLALPIMIQNGITNFVNMLDNIMVGGVGTVEMTGVAVSNQLLFVFELCIFGAISGAGIFGAQFYGKGDVNGIRNVFRFKCVFGTLITILSILVFVFGGETLISFYLKGDGSAEDIAATLKFGKEYLFIMVIGLIPYTLSQCYSSTLRECGKPVLPMVAGIVAVIVNLVLNYILIFGKLGVSALGVNGAAIATVISRFAEMLIIAMRTYARRKTNPFIIGAFSSLKVPLDLVKKIIVKGTPLMMNETLWSAGVAFLNQCYSVRGLEVVAAANIAQTFFNVFSVAFMAVGVSIGIILGQTLGSNENINMIEYAFKLITFSFFVSIIVAVMFFLLAEIIPYAYNTNESVRNLSTSLMRICAFAIPIDALAQASYYTLRSGGKTIETIIFDSGFIWVITIPMAFVISRYTNASILILYAASRWINILKSFLGLFLVKRGIWVNNIVDN